jgi:hypothetical protein
MSASEWTRIQSLALVATFAFERTPFRAFL